MEILVRMNVGTALVQGLRGEKGEIALKLKNGSYVYAGSSCGDVVRVSIS